ncbi:MAG TPA: acyltransferase [Candidatus Dormibacteraeota bacterium]|jgi:peptidoglycan/LPS O-acetylase OafA/YrhL|nr:acyltransferase [Candidatus Dormibacteraeota bacterium]
MTSESAAGGTPAIPGGNAAEAGTPEEVAAPKQIDQSGETRSVRLESMRALAASAVMVGHTFGQSIGYGAPALATYPRRVVYGGGFGVFIFFCLSGYLLYRPFAVRDVGDGATVNLARYARNRVLRILPLYYAVVIVLIFLDPQLRHRLPLLKFATFTQTLFADTADLPNSLLWSVTVEIVFYATLPFLAWGIAVVARRSALRAAIVILALGAVSYVVWLTYGPHSLEHLSLGIHSFAANFVYFTPGMLLALIRTSWAGVVPSWLPAILQRSTLWLLASAGLMMIVFYRYDLDLLVMTAGFLAVGACVLPIRDGILLRALDWRPLAILGLASYSLFVWHFPIVSALPAGSSWLHFAVLLPIGAVLSIAAALVSYWAIESPFLRLRRRWSSASAATGTSQGSNVEKRPAS